MLTHSQQSMRNVVTAPHLLFSSPSPTAGSHSFFHARWAHSSASSSTSACAVLLGSPLALEPLRRAPDPCALPPARVPHRGSRSAATVTQTTRRGPLRSRTPSPPTRSSPRSPGSPRSHASSSSGSVPGARSRAQAPPPPGPIAAQPQLSGQRSWRWGRQWRGWSSPTTTSLGRFRRGKKHQ